MQQALKTTLAVMLGILATNGLLTAANRGAFGVRGQRIAGKLGYPASH